MEVEAKIRFLSGPLTEQVINLPNTEIFIGRDIQNYVCVQDPKVSRRHARIYRQGDTWMIENLSQTTFVAVNQQRVKQSVLQHNAVVKLGERTSFVFLIQQVGTAPVSPRPEATPTGTVYLPALEAGVPTLSVSSNVHSNVQRYLLTRPVMSIGRDPDNDIDPAEAIVSGRHALIVREGDSLFLEHPHPDRPRTLNGLWYQGVLIRGDQRFRRKLSHGDIFLIGSESGTLVTFVYDDGSGTSTEESPELPPVALTKDRITIGRAPENDVVLNNMQVSARHAWLEKVKGGYHIFDNRSTNHVYVNGEPVIEQVLHTNDEIRIGPYRFNYTGTELKQYDESSSIRIDAQNLKKVGSNSVILLEVTLSHRTHLATLPFCHVLTPDGVSARTASWLQGAATAGWPLPLALAHDLGLLLSQPANLLTLVKPAYLPFDEDTSAYLSCLERLAAHSLVRELPSWSPPLPDAVLSVLLARLVAGLDLPQDYCLPSGPDGVRFLQALDHELAHTDPATLWQQIPPDARPSWRNLLTPQALTRLECNLQALDREEIRFLVQYGAPILGSPDPRTLLDLLALTGLPAHVRLALSQTLRLLPQVSESATHQLGGIQTYPEGGYEGLARQGSLESLLPGENVYPDDLFLHRVLNHEALYYGRERPREQGREVAYLVGQLGWGLGGDGQVLVRALLLALGQAMRKLGYEVFYSLAGATLSTPYPLEKPAEVGRLLYVQEKGGVNSEAVLQGVLEQLQAWRGDYRSRQVLWVLSSDFDEDDAEVHEALYQALQAEGEQYVWYVRMGSVLARSYDTGPPPVTARYFCRWQVVESGRLWRSEEERLAAWPEEESAPVIAPFPVERLTLRRTLTGHTSYVFSMAISPDGQTLVSGSGDKTIKVWNLLTGQEVHTLVAHRETVRSMVITSDNRTLVSGSWDCTIKIWNLSTGKEVRTLTGHANPVLSLVVSPDGQTLVSGNADGTIKVWDLSTGQEVQTLTGHTSDVYSLVVRPDGQTLISGSSDRTIKVWDLSTGQEVQTLAGHTKSVYCIAISPDGQTLVSGDMGGLIKVWDLPTREEVRTLTGHTYAVWSVAISPDGQTLVSGSADGTIKVWDLSTGQEVRTLTDPKSYVYKVAISPDGQTLVSGSNDGTIEVWRG